MGHIGTMMQVAHIVFYSLKLDAGTIKALY